MPHAMDRLFATPMISPVFPSSNIAPIYHNLVMVYSARMPEAREELAEIIRTNSLRRGEFVLSSGKKANYYLDCRMTTLHPRGALLIARLILQKMRQLQVHADAIGGLTLGADPIVAAVAVVSEQDGVPLRGFIVRKEAKTHGMQRFIEGWDGLP